MKIGVLEEWGVGGYVEGRGECGNSMLAASVSCGVAVLFCLRREWELRDEETVVG